MGLTWRCLNWQVYIVKQISSTAALQNQAQEQTNDGLSGVLAFVQRHFSQCNAALMPAEDALKQLSMI